MSLVKRTYVDQETVITAENLNAIQDAIIENEEAIEDQGEAIEGKYSKPAGGIPATDMASGVQTSLGKADSALQSSDIDSTLTVAGKAADAKKTGDEISDVKNTLNQLIQESAFEIVEENGEFKLYWYGAQGECPYTIVYENGVYNLYFNYTTA